MTFCKSPTVDADVVVLHPKVYSDIDDITGTTSVFYDSRLGEELYTELPLLYLESNWKVLLCAFLAPGHQCFRRRTGTGLNFALCRRLAHAHQETEQQISP